MTLGHVMVATDFSGNATEALLRAAMIARLGTFERLTIAHVLERRLLDALRELIGHDPDPQIGQIVEARLREQADELRHRSRLEVASRCLDGDRRAALVEEARRSDSALIVLGAQGTNGLRRWLLGSTADRIVSSAPAAVLVVKRRARRRYRRVLLPVDLRTPPEAAIALARALAPGAERILMHAYEVPFEGQLRQAGVDQPDIEHYRERAQAQADRALYELRTRLTAPGEICEVTATRGVPDQAILGAEASFKPDLLVMPRHAAGKIERWVLGSVTRRVVEQCRTDIAVLPPA